MLKDNYVLSIKSDGTLYYFKNGLLHRENGPAIINSMDKGKDLNLSDESLYTKEITPYSKEATYLEDDELWEYPVYLFISTSYYLNGIQYSKEEFTARKLRKELAIELENQLTHTQEPTEAKRTKV